MRRPRVLQIVQELVPIVAEAVRGAKTMAEARERLARKALAGDLDNVIAMVGEARISIDRYVRRG